MILCVYDCGIVFRHFITMFPFCVKSGWPIGQCAEDHLGAYNPIHGPLHPCVDSPSLPRKCQAGWILFPTPTLHISSNCIALNMQSSPKKWLYSIQIPAFLVGFQWSDSIFLMLRSVPHLQSQLPKDCCFLPKLDQRFFWQNLINLSQPSAHQPQFLSISIPKILPNNFRLFGQIALSASSGRVRCRSL